MFNDLNAKKLKLKALLEGKSILAPSEIKYEEFFVDARPKGSLELLPNGNLSLIHPYNEKLIKEYHKIGQIKFNRNFKAWECNIDKADFITTRFFFNIEDRLPLYNIQITEEAKNKINARWSFFQESMKETSELKQIKKKKDIDLDLSFLKHPLFPFQKVGVAFLNKIEGVGMLGDEQGLGKSVQALAYTQAHKLYTIIVCPASLKYNWKNEIEKFTNASVSILTQFDEKTLNPDNNLAEYIIINYEQLEKYQKYLNPKKRKFDCVIIDESHYIQNLQAKRTKLVFKLFKDIKKRILISGTAVKNRPLDFYAQLKFLRPDLFKLKMPYVLRYCDAKETSFGWDYNGASNLDELERRISTFYIRRLKSEVLTDLPAKTKTLIEIEMNAREKSDYLKTKKEFASFLQKINFKNSEQGLSLVKNKIMEQRMFCSNNKVKRVIEFVKDFLNSNEDRKIIVFSQFIKTQKDLRDAFLSEGVSLLGEDNSEKRNESVLQFQNDPKKRVFIASLKAAQEGLNLTVSDTVVFADLSWSPADHAQAADRVHRIGQEKPVFIYYFMFKDSIEEDIWKKSLEKTLIIETLDEKRFSEATETKFFKDLIGDVE